MTTVRLPARAVNFNIFSLAFPCWVCLYVLVTLPGLSQTVLVRSLFVRFLIFRCVYKSSGTHAQVVLTSQIMSPEMLDELLAAPALPPPEGVTPNFENPHNANGLAWFVTTICMVVATFCLCLRGFARMWLEKRVGIEESEHCQGFLQKS